MEVFDESPSAEQQLNETIRRVIGPGGVQYAIDAVVGRDRFRRRSTIGG